MPDKAPSELLDALVEQVARLADASDVPPRRVRLQAGDLSVEVDWPDPAAAQTVLAAPNVLAAPAVIAAGAAPAQAAVEADDGTHTLGAPLVGVFYRSPEPGAAPYVKEGDVVSKGQQIGIVEAMKLMNPLEADLAGRVVRFLAADGDPVEYGQPILLLEPDGSA